MLIKEILMGLATLLNWLFLSDLPSDPEGHVNSTKVIEATYDFIIVGAGSAGAVIANRLTEVSGWNVLLVEAGGDESLFGQIPALAASLQMTSNDWQYVTTIQPNRSCLSMINQTCKDMSGPMPFSSGGGAEYATSNNNKILLMPNAESQSPKAHEIAELDYKSFLQVAQDPAAGSRERTNRFLHCVKNQLKDKIVEINIYSCQHNQSEERIPYSSYFIMLKTSADPGNPIYR